MSVQKLQASPIWNIKPTALCTPHGKQKLIHFTLLLSRPPGPKLAIKCGVRFRPCIDVHKGIVKQIVGSTLQDSKEEDLNLITNFVSDKSATEYVKMYRDYGLPGGHVFMLEADPLSISAALEAIHAYPDKWWFASRSINSSNALSYIDEGASHVIVTSYVFHDGVIDFERLKELANVVQKTETCVGSSCIKKEDRYAIVTDRWQKFSDVYLDQNCWIFWPITPLSFWSMELMLKAKC